MANVRICVCGDDGTGKTSLIASLVKDVFVKNKIQPVLPQVTLPPSLGTPENVTTTIVDTSALPGERNSLKKEIRKSNVILLAYSDHYSYERVALFWLPYFRSLGVNVPVVLCSNKADLTANGNSTAQVVQDEMLPVMNEFKEIDSCIRTSAREHYNINEVFFLCQKAVTHPIAPLFDSKELTLKPAAVEALRRIFYLCDRDQDHLLNDDEIQQFQSKVFEKTLSIEDLNHIKQSVNSAIESERINGIDERGFIQLNQMFIEKGRHETVWMILRKFNYADSLNLQESFLHPKFDVSPFSSAELSPIGYRFFVDLFVLFDKDNDGGLDDSELNALFAPTPGLPPSWIDADFPSCTVRNDAGHVTLQGWLAQWSMTTFEDAKITLEYLAYLGFETSERGGTTAALRVTKARKKRRAGRVERSVFLCYVLGASHAGKSALLAAFLNRSFDTTYHPTIRPRVAVNSVELAGGKQCCLILKELGELEPAILDNSAKLDACDILCYAYDSSDPSSFAHVLALRAAHPKLDELPAVFAALKADRDRTVQRSEVQPDQYTEMLDVPAPLHVSVKWGSISELFGQLAESARAPVAAFSKREVETPDRSGLYVGFGAVTCAAAAVLIYCKRNSLAW